jgi:hypothetical protein
LHRRCDWKAWEPLIATSSCVQPFPANGPTRERLRRFGRASAKKAGVRPRAGDAPTAVQPVHSAFQRPAPSAIAYIRCMHCMCAVIACVPPTQVRVGRGRRRLRSPRAAPRCSRRIERLTAASLGFVGLVCKRRGRTPPGRTVRKCSASSISTVDGNPRRSPLQRRQGQAAVAQRPA